MHSIVLMIFMIVIFTLLIVYYNCNESYSNENNQNDQNNQNNQKKYCYNVKNGCEKTEQTNVSCSSQYMSDTLRNCQKLMVSSDLNDIVSGSYENRDLPQAFVGVTFDQKTLSGELELKNVTLSNKLVKDSVTFPFRLYDFNNNGTKRIFNGYYTDNDDKNVPIAFTSSGEFLILSTNTIYFKI
jgi:hypothetical protein